MSSAALQDLQNRINSNTLTALQQAALSTALATIIPIFPQPDEQSAIVSNLEEPLAREWYGALYTINEEGGGAGVLPTQSPAFFINALTGSNTNSGTTAGAPLASFAGLATLFRGTAGGGRPQLNPVGGVMTITVQTAMPASDPMSAILDVDLGPGVTLLIVGTAIAPALSSTLTTASAFARTNAAGQEKITDAAVPNYGVFVTAGAGQALLFQDTAGGRAGVGWLYAPDGAASATGILTPVYTPQVAGTISVPTPVQPLAADTYTLSAVQQVFLGTGFQTRQFPQNPQAPSVALGAQVIFYRLHLAQAAVNDVGTFQDAVNVNYTLQECQYDEQLIAIDAALSLVNCMGFHATGLLAGTGGSITALAGGINGQGTGTLRAIVGGIATADLDFLVASTSGPGFTNQAGIMFLGNVAHWGTLTVSATLATLTDDAQTTLNPLFQATSILYGSDGGDFLSVGATTTFSGDRFIYSQTGSGHPAADQFQSTSTAFLLGRGPSTSAFGISPATGLAVGPTTNTIAHLDAALAAGTGFGSLATDPASGSFLGVAA